MVRVDEGGTTNEQVTLAESVISALRDHVNGAKLSGWAAEDFKIFFAIRGVLLADYMSAINGRPVSRAVADTLAGVSVFGITGFPASKSFLLDFPTVTDLRRHLLKAAFQPVAVRTGDKVPTMTGWQNLTGEIPTENGRLNTGINTRGLRAVDFDIDDAERAETALRLLRDLTGQEPLLKRTRKGSTRLMTLWRAPSGTEPGKEQVVLPFKNLEGKDERVEILGSGQMFVAFGRHPSGEFLEWGVRSPLNTSVSEIPVLTAEQEGHFLDAVCRELGGRKPGREGSAGHKEGFQNSDQPRSAHRRGNLFGFDVNPNPFWRRVNDKALASLGEWIPALFPSARYQPGTGGYRVSSTALGRDLEEDLSITPFGIKDFGVHDLGHPNEGKYSPIGLVMEFSGKDPKSAAFWLCEQMGLFPSDLGWEEGGRRQKETHEQAGADETEAETSSSHGSDAPSNILDLWDEYVVPAFPLDVLPPAIARWVEMQSETIGCDASALAMAALANFSAALDHRFSLKMMRHGLWYATPRLWILLVGDPSRKKTPAISAATRDLVRAQDALWDEYERFYAEYQDAKENGDKGVKEPQKPPRYTVGDATVEKLGEILSRSDRGLLVKRDEFSGWIGSLEKYAGTGKGSSADRAFWLQAFDGGPFTVDRVSRGELRIRNLSVSFVGGIQPGRLAELRGLTSDGLLQRFLPVMMAASRFPRDEPLSETFNGYGRLTTALLSASPADLIMSDEAHEVAADLRKELFELEQVASGLADGFQAFLGKLAGLFGSLALVLHMLHRPEHGNCERLERRTALNAAKLVREFVLPHAFEFYRSSEATTEGDRLQKIGSYLLTSGKERFLASDLTSNVALLRGVGLVELNKQLSPLIAGGWLEAFEAGPVSKIWRLLPGVRAALAARTAQEEARKAALSSLMNSGRKQRSG